VEADDARIVGESLLVLGRIHTRGARSGLEIDSDWSAVVQFKDGKAISAWDWLDHAPALEAVGCRSSRVAMSRAIEVKIEMLIARPSEVVWAFVSDLERLPEWLGEFCAVVKQSGGPVAEGTVFRYTIEPGQRSSTLQIVEWEPERRLAWDGPPLKWHGGAGRPRGYFEVTDAGGGCARLVSCYQPVLTGTMALLAPVMKRWLRKQRLTDSARLKTLLETSRS
jgi:uncharacterized protein YndB with AHSA1/START domain